MKTYKERTEEILAKAEELRRRKSVRRKRIAAGASCCLAAVLIAGTAALWLHTDGRPAAEGDMGDVVCAENYDEIAARLSPHFDGHWTGTGDDQPSGNPSYEGVPPLSDASEAFGSGDRLARVGSRAFYLTSTGELQVYSAQEGGRLLGALSVSKEAGGRFDSACAVYVRSDLSAATVIGTLRIGGEDRTAIYTVDTKDPHTMSVTEVQYLSGAYTCSYTFGEQTFVLTQMTVSEEDLADGTAFIPRFGSSEALECLPAEDIFLTNGVPSPTYAVVAAVTPAGSIAHAYAFLGFSAEARFFGSGCFLTCTHAEEGGEAEGRIVTDIVRVSLEEGARGVGVAATVDGATGSLRNIDCYDGYLRVFTTTGAAENGTNASLAILHAETLLPVSRIEAFAQSGERVRAVRFDAARAYVRTSEEEDAPLYVFDLSNVKKIVCTAEETLPARMAERTPFTDGLFLELERPQGNFGLKAALFDGQGGLAASFWDGDVVGCSAHAKAYYLDRERALIGLGVRLYSQNTYAYLLLRLRGDTLAEEACISVACSYDLVRAFCENGSLYLFDGTMKVYPMSA